MNPAPRKPSLARRLGPFDVIVVGAGHAGCEAALSAARCGATVLCITLRLDGIAQLSCNPAVGGVGKGHLVREIDALGGAMGWAADTACMQGRRLNESRGAAVRSTRLQVDAGLYRAAMRARLTQAVGVTVVVDEVMALVTDSQGRLGGIATRRHGTVVGRTVVITTGTFLNGSCHTGATQVPGGRAGEPPVSALSAALRQVGLQLGRFKTGTTPRLDGASIDFAALEAQPGEVPPPRLSLGAAPTQRPQVSCHLTHTTGETHAVVRAHLHASALYLGHIAGRGPRYCPSLEDKVVRFADRDRHPVFLEPEGYDTPCIYPAGLSNSLPEAAQLAFLRTLPGLAQVRVLRFGYAVEYDFVPPTQLTPALMARCLEGLFLAGQINGSSGYEEAAAQGLMAGLNAARWGRGEPPAVLPRQVAYMGVLIDDLTRQGVDEPYRMFPSRCEERLSLRESNAETRLGARAAAWGLWDACRTGQAAQRARCRATLWAWLRRRRLQSSHVARLGEVAQGGAGMRLEDLLRRPGVSLAALLEATGGPPGAVAAGSAAAAPEDGQAAAGAAIAAPLDAEVVREVEEEAQYAGHVACAGRAQARQAAAQGLRLPDDLDYARCPGLSGELVEKLSARRPRTLGEAAAIAGITPAALSILQLQALRRRLAPQGFT